MQNEECVFCKIVEGKLPSAKIFEDEDHVAFFDLFPRVKGQTVVVTKKHYGGYAFDLSDDVYEKILLFAKKLGKNLDKILGAERTVMVTEGFGVDHIHVKLFPNPPGAYEGYTTTALGPKVEMEELKKFAEEIKNKIAGGS